jgi:hypothetical protein
MKLCRRYRRTKRQGRIALAVLTLGFSMFLGACAAPESGVVYGRYHYPTYQWVQMVCASYNAKGLCVVQVPVVQTDPERWSLGLRNGDDEGQRTVTVREYENCQVGDNYPGCVNP